MSRNAFVLQEKVLDHRFGNLFSVLNSNALEEDACVKLWRNNWLKDLYMSDLQPLRALFSTS